MRPNARRATWKTDDPVRGRRASRSCSRISSGPRTWRRRSATRPGSGSCDGTTTRSGISWHAGRGEIVNSTGDGFFAAFDTARAALETAISIQRALEAHRDATGFAISVRIGLHTAEANVRGADYSGKGVHVAARVGALAAGGEILATQETLSEAGEPATTGVRSVPIRGVTEPVRIATVSWT